MSRNYQLFILNVISRTMTRQKECLLTELFDAAVNKLVHSLRIQQNAH